MESNLYRMIQLLELQLVKTDLADAWLRRIWQDKINELMLKVSRTRAQAASKQLQVSRFRAQEFFLII